MAEVLVANKKPAENERVAASRHNRCVFDLHARRAPCISLNQNPRTAPDVEALFFFFSYVWNFFMLIYSV